MDVALYKAANDRASVGDTERESKVDTDDVKDDASTWV